MAAYDPKRTRPTRDEAEAVPAQVDALLEPTAPEPQVAPEANVESDVTSESDVEPTVDLRVADVPVVTRPAAEPAAPTERVVPPVLAAPAPDGNTQRVAVVAGLAAATVAAVLLWRRSRRRR